MDRYVQSMVINITDICNMECEFCLRGDAHEKKLDLSLVPKMFESICAVESLTLTGGEPSTYPEAVAAIKDYILDHRDELDVNGMFIATNAKVYCQELVDAVKEVMHLYIEKIYGDKTIDFGSRNMPKIELDECKYRFNVAVSLDRFHEPVDMMNYIRYVTSGVYSESKECDYRYGILDRGRAYGMKGAHKREYEEFGVDVDGGDVTAESVYITVDGDVFADCDMSYEMEEHNEPAGSLKEESLADIMDRWAKEEEEEDEEDA